jgi:hypothetical protein
LPWLRYVDADDLDGDEIDFDGLKVRDTADNKLGSVDGFIVDVSSGRPYYVVVDSGGWFKSKDFLLPIGHVQLSGKRDELVADVPKDRIDRFPGFDKSKFEELSETELRSMNDAIVSVCSVAGTTYLSTGPLSSAWDLPDYRQPDWWRIDPSRFERPPVGSTASPLAGTNRSTYQPPQPSRERETVVARETNVSPHFDGRAQPGDVIGVETGGEQTHIGDTTQNEDKRRHDAEESVRKSRDK